MFRVPLQRFIDEELDLQIELIARDAGPRMTVMFTGSPHIKATTSRSTFESLRRVLSLRSLLGVGKTNSGGSALSASRRQCFRVASYEATLVGLLTGSLELVNQLCEGHCGDIFTCVAIAIRQCVIS